MSEVRVREVGLLLPGLVMTGRLLASITLLLVVYYQMPTHQGSVLADLPWIGLDLLLFAVIVGVQVPLILRAKHPLLRSVEALGLTSCLYLLLFARTYVSLSAAQPTAFNQPLDHSNALYFAVTVFATVGFGDIAAVDTPVKLVVTVQMILNLVLLGVVVRLLITAGRRGMERRQA